jgi:predicted translin family RNA/ssDNA-binding protein
MGPIEEPQELSYKIANNTYATVTPMGNWLAMRDDRDRFRDDWQAMVKQIEELEKQLEIYKDLYAAEIVGKAMRNGV